jgi:hypothetical protein
MIAALYIKAGGPYCGLDGVDPWDIKRDARAYSGPWSVVAHPPCERWGSLWYGGPMRLKLGLPALVKGDDDGCFAAALAAVRRWGGVLEHPKGSGAWDHFGLKKPHRAGGWSVADWEGGWTCCVDQGHYGHRSPKPTWLYACGVDLPALAWGRAVGLPTWDLGHPSRYQNSARIGTKRIPESQRAATSLPFRDLLIGIARTARLVEAAA